MSLQFLCSGLSLEDYCLTNFILFSWCRNLVNKKIQLPLTLQSWCQGTVFSGVIFSASPDNFGCLFQISYIVWCGSLAHLDTDIFCCAGQELYDCPIVHLLQSLLAPENEICLSDYTITSKNITSITTNQDNSVTTLWHTDMYLE